MRTRKFILEVSTSSGVTDGELMAFILEAISTWGGQRHPDDPLFNSCQKATITKITGKTYSLGDHT